MKKKTVFILMLGVLLMLSFVFVGCPDDSNNDDNENNTGSSVAKKITITGITGGYDVASISITSSPTGTPVAGGEGNISGGSVTFNLKNVTNSGLGTDFTGSGSFYVSMQIAIKSESDSTKVCWYKGDKADVALPSLSEGENPANVERINITGAVTTIAFSRFQAALLSEFF